MSENPYADYPPEAVDLAIKLGVATADCAEAGLSLENIDDVTHAAFETWRARFPGWDGSHGKEDDD